jgi:hypothetical protein
VPKSILWANPAISLMGDRASASRLFRRVHTKFVTLGTSARIRALMASLTSRVVAPLADRRVEDYPGRVGTAHHPGPRSVGGAHPTRPGTVIPAGGLSGVGVGRNAGKCENYRPVSMLKDLPAIFAPRFLAGERAVDLVPLMAARTVHDDLRRGRQRENASCATRISIAIGLRFYPSFRK